MDRQRAAEYLDVLEGAGLSENTVRCTQDKEVEKMFAFIPGLPGHFEMLILIIMVALVIVPFWRIFSKAGFPGALSVLMLVPFVNLIMIFFLAFADWPALRQQNKG